MAMFEDMFDEFPLHPSLRIPPLLDPLPFLSATLDRPSPLEPNARVNANIDNETAKLTGRRKALAEAKPLGDSGSNDLRPLQKSPRKRQKLYDHERIAEFVQLPKPKTKAKEDKPPPFQPISVLNELHEPPPSAALFPPITPSARQDEQDWIEASAKLLKSGELPTAKKKRTKEEKSGATPARRLNLRPRMKWSEAETEQLVKGVAIYGMGKWKKILHHAEFSFLPGRTPVDLKDRFRTCFPQRLPDKSKASTEKSEVQQPHGSSDGPLEPSLHQLNLRPPGKRSQPHSSRSPGPNRRKARKRPWTEEEDAALVEGYRLHGFQWTQMAKHPSLKFVNRSGPQVRDRFRLRYPDLYEQGGSTGPDLFINSNEAASTSTIERRPSTSAGLKPRHPLDESEDSDHDETENEHEDREPPGGQKSSAAVSKAAAAATAPYGIMGLLNDDEEDNRPSASFRYDDWDENVTLPPLLLWEDMATRPMFELE